MSKKGHTQHREHAGDMYTHHERQQDLNKLTQNTRHSQAREIPTGKTRYARLKHGGRQHVKKQLTAEDYMTPEEYEQHLKQQQEPVEKTCYRTGRQYLEYPDGRTEYID